jgi:hypothetical protein
MRRSRGPFCLATVVLSCLLACAAEDSTGGGANDTSGDTAECTLGATQECLCDQGGPALVSCQPDGRWGGCACSTPDTTDEDTTPDACAPDCEGAQCGPDGCGGSCGDCGAGMACEGGICVGSDACALACEEAECGPDGCGGSCGECPAGHQCNDWGKCLCAPDCEGRECGDDGCGGSCGTCGECMCIAGSCTGCGEDDVAVRARALFIPMSAPYGGAESGDPELAGAVCPDLTGDGAPDNAFAELFDVVMPLLPYDDVNQILADGLDDRSLNLLFTDVMTASEASPLIVAGFAAPDDDEPSVYWMDPAAYGDDGTPQMGFSGVEVLDGGGFVSSENDITLTFNAIGFTMGMPITRAWLSGALPEGPDVPVVHHGVLAGAIFRADILLALDMARQVCATMLTPPPECSYLDMLTPDMVDNFVTFDLDIPGCDKAYAGQPSCAAVSLCATWSGAPVILGGFAEEPVMFNPDCSVADPGMDRGAETAAAPLLLIASLFATFFLARRRFFLAPSREL